jgi:alkanesulfonate monooxygenase SsuD/methylene tetrahydromethanopterin reductase-like flavin-dependent oxidoreductase (luciferase family)
LVKRNAQEEAFVMRFAHFAHVWGKAGMTPAQRYAQLWRELSLCDEVGLDYGFCVEHHFTPDESWMSAPNIYAASVAARTKRIRVGGMGHVVPLHNPVRLTEEIALLDQVTGGRLEVGLVPGVSPRYFGPYNADYATKRELTLEYVGFLKAAYAGEGAFSFDGAFHRAKDLTLSVLPMQRPHPPLWIETRDPPTLEFCAREGINTGYFITYPREHARQRYAKFLTDWHAAGWQRKPEIGYSTVVYVDKTDSAAVDKALSQAARAYRGFFGNPKTQVELEERKNENARRHEEKGDFLGAEIVRNLLNPDYLLGNDLVVIGSPETVAAKIKSFAAAGHFNVFMGEFNFGDLADDDLMRSIRLFGEAVIPELRGYEPF